MTIEEWTLITGILGGLVGIGTFLFVVFDRAEHCRVFFVPGEAVDFKQDSMGAQYEVPADGFIVTIRNTGHRSFYVDSAYIEAKEMQETYKLWFSQKSKISNFGIAYGGDRFELEPGRSVIPTIPERPLIDTFRVQPGKIVSIRLKVTLESGKVIHSKYLELSGSADKLE